MRRILNIVAKNWLLVLMFFCGIFLRFYRFSDFATFLGDQGRDAIVIKRMLTFEHLPAIGAPTSVGQVYLGPFYYYFIAPWLLLFKFNPLGLTFGVALFSSLFILINYFIVKELFDKKVALIAAFLTSFSYVLIDLSRFSWNPNLLPLFSLLTIYFFIKALKTKKKLFYLLFGAFLSFSFQLHYLALALFLPIIILALPKLISKFPYFLISLFSFIFFSSPLIIFDLRHQFLNSKNLISLFKTSSSIKTNLLKNILDTFSTLNRYLFNTNFSNLINIILLIAIIIFLFTYLKRKKDQIFNFQLIFLLSLFVLSLYSGEKHPHYLAVLYPFYIIVISVFLSTLLNSFWEKILVIIFLITFVILNFQKYNFLFYQGSNQLKTAQEVARTIFDNVKKKGFTVTALPEKYSDSTYRYFLEIWKKRPIEKDSLEKAEELFVVCEKNCQPVIGNPQWDIAYFAPTKIEGEWNINSIRIYKLTR